MNGSHGEGSAEDKMFHGTFLIALNALFIFPVFGLLTFIVTWVKTSLLAGLIYVALFPALCLFEWAYVGWIKDIIHGFNAIRAEKSGVLGRLRDSRKQLFRDIDNIVK